MAKRVVSKKNGERGREQTENGKPNVCLAMIVRNEEKVIARCLNSAKPFISSYCIADTGSTDKTKKVILETMKGVPGQILDHAWVNYGENRTQVFEEIFKDQNVDYALVLDADDTLAGDPNFPLGKNTDCFETMIQTEGIAYYQRRIFSNKIEWEYRGAIHEAPFPKTEIKTQVPLNPHTLKIVHHGDGTAYKSEKDKYREHVKLARSQDLSDPRNQFYLAQSLNATGDFTAALEEYRKRVKMDGGWQQERFYSQYKIARIYHRLGESNLALNEYLAAYELDHQRAEPLYQLCRMCRQAGKYGIGYMVGKIAIGIPVPAINQKLFLEPGAWGPDLYDEFGICAYYMGHHYEARRAFERALIMGGMDQPLEKQVRLNLAFAITAIQQAKTKSAGV